MNGLFRPEWSTLKKLMFLQSASGGSYATISGNPVSFTALAAPLRKLSIAFSPVQDLHGQDAPWPAGGGVNKANLAGATIYETLPTWASASVDIDAEEITITGTPTGTSSQFRLIRVPNIENGLGLKAFGSNLVNGLLWDGTNHTIQVVLTGMTAGTAVNIKFKLVAYEGQTAPTAWSPYENLCPISGWDSLTVEQRGKNLWDETWELGTIDAQGQPKPSTTVIRAVNYCSIVGGSTVFGYIGSDGTITINWYDADKNFISAKSVGNTTATAPANAAFFRIRMSSGYGTTYLNNISINYPSTDHEYHAYNPSSRSISISLGSTVYSGWVDAVTGIGEVTMAKLVLDGTQTIANVNWQPNADSVGWFYNFNDLDILFPPTILDVTTAKSDVLKANSYNSIFASHGNEFALFPTAAGGVTYKRIIIRTTDTTLTTAETINAYLSVHPITIIYPLATPIPIQLTPQEINSLAGENVLFSDANGDLTVTYRSN